MNVPALYVVADRAVFDSDDVWLSFLVQVAAIDGAEVAVQVRVKGLPASARRPLVECAARIARSSRRPFFLNGAAAEAIELGFAGVHWPEAAIPDGSAALPPSLRASASVHALEPAGSSAIAGADFVVAGSVFVPGSKPGEGRGVGWLRDLCAEAPLPVIAIGGIRPENVAACVAAGAAGVAVVTGITRAADPLAAVDPYLRELRAAKARALAEVRP